MPYNEQTFKMFEKQALASGTEKENIGLILGIIFYVEISSAFS